jgi:competence protein ComEA
MIVSAPSIGLSASRHSRQPTPTHRCATQEAVPGIAPAARLRATAQSVDTAPVAVTTHQGGYPMLRKLFAAALALAIALPTIAATPVNINKADATTIADALDGIGQSKAEAIVAWRDAHGPFKSADELSQVKGIGKATIERNRDAIRFSGETEATAEKPAKARHAKKSKTDAE